MAKNFRFFIGITGEQPFYDLITEMDEHGGFTTGAIVLLLAGTKLTQLSACNAVVSDGFMLLGGSGGRP